MNNLARLGDVKSDEVGVSGTSALDAVLDRGIEEVSREFESETGCSFVARYGIRYLERQGRAPFAELAIREPLASISALVVDDDGDGDYEITLAENTDYWVERLNDLDTNTPIVILRLNPDATTIQITRWPTRRRGVKLTGLWGYSYELEDTTLNTAEELDASETDVTVDAAAATLIYQGDTVIVDSEQMAVASVAGLVLSVVRGINGTTAATHDTATSVYIRRYPRDVEEVVRERTVGKRWDSQSGYAGGITLTGDPQGAAGRTEGRASFARWARTIRRYKNWAVS